MDLEAFLQLSCQFYWQRCLVKAFYSKFLYEKKTNNGKNMETVC